MLANKIKDTDKPIYDYSGDLEDDSKLQKILELSENLYLIDFYVDEYIIEDCLIFLYDKIEYLENLQNSFGLKNTNTRLTDISKLVTATTIESFPYNPIGNMESKISLTLDLLYNAANIFTNYHVA